MLYGRRPMLCSAILMALAAAALPSSAADDGPSSSLALRLRHRVETETGSDRWHALTRAESWDGGRTAIIVCDMWDTHTSPNAASRVGELAPRMNDVLKAARERGVTIIHAPSGCMGFYKDHPARRHAQQTPRAKELPAEIGKWCYWIPAEERDKYPVDQSDGGWDDDPDAHAAFARRHEAMGRNPKAPWIRQIDRLEIRDADFLSDSGEEVWSILESRGIDHVILMGVHTNMCVLGRPFGLRQMAKNGKRVVLMRDLTDTMYNPRSRPFVSHFTGTDLIVEHIEKYVCPTITSDQILGGRPFRFAGDPRPRLVIISSEDEYQTERTLPEFARKHLGRDFAVECVFGGAKDHNTLPGIEALNDADVALLSLRRRVLPPEQMAVIRRYVESGRPLVALRTSSHAFALRNAKAPDGYADWPEFDHAVLGGNYHNHHGNGPTVALTVAPDAADHPILRDVDLSQLVGRGSLYKTRPLADTATPLLIGTIPGQEPEPVAWTNQPASGNRVVYTSLGHVGDFAQPAFTQLLHNALRWAAGL